jgi:diguanylate cyclase (GGDEF)-like protein
MKQSISTVMSRLSVKWKILGPFSLLTAIVGVLLITLFSSIFARYQDQVVTDRARHASSNIVYALETMYDFDELERYASIAGAEPDVNILLVIDADTRKILTSNRRALQGELVSKVADPALKEELARLFDGSLFSEVVYWSNDSASYAVPASTMISSTGGVLDTIVFVQLKTRYITAQSSVVATQLAIGLVIGLAIAMLVASKLLLDLIITPLSSMRDITQTRQVDASSMSAFTSRLDEFGELARSILMSFTEARENADRFAIQAQSDSLTGLGNRSMFQEQLHACLARAERSGKLVALMILDLDHFKDVNDTLGHHVGDQLLQKVANILRENSRAVDTVVRLGGDEFAIILDDLDRIDGAVAQANRILQSLSETHSICGHDLHPGASIGITSYPQDGREPDVLLKNADLALYRAKSEGRGNIQLYRHELHLRVIERNAIERDLRTALNEGQFVLFYQPKMDLASGKIAGAEALVRWMHPDRGMVPPDVFISVAEKNGLICDLTDWVMEEACRQVRAWMDAGVEPVSVAVNVSALDLRRPDFTDRVAATLVSAGISPKYLEIEVTESTMMHDVDQVIGTLRRLRALGVSISIDDFGTGYSSLSYLKKFPVQRLKIDRSFVIDMTDNVNSHAIPQLIIDLARNLGVSVLAEGVETEEQRDILSSMGCHEAQGYLYSAPVPIEKFEILLEEGFELSTKIIEGEGEEVTDSVSVA